MKTGQAVLIPTVVGRLPRYKLPFWGMDLLDGYLFERIREGREKSTLAMDRCACSRFLQYISAIGITSIGALTPSAIKAFGLHDSHSTIEGKNAYICRVRSFLSYLALRRIVPGYYPLAVSCETAPATRIIRTLSQKQQESIAVHRTGNLSPMDLRRNAMVSLGLRMGLRSIDIVQLRLSDICWTRQQISITQKKTGKPLVLPFPVEVGNCLYRYINEGRPGTTAPEIFVNHRVPFGALKTKACNVALDACLVQSGENANFHMTRKTFASKLLCMGNPVPLISDALGHCGDSTLDEYLSTDGERMRLCAIDLSGIEFREARL
jgi:site-specific recombinase XerD